MYTYEELTFACELASNLPSGTDVTMDTVNHKMEIFGGSLWQVNVHIAEDIYIELSGGGVRVVSPTQICEFTSIASLFDCVGC